MTKPQLQAGKYYKRRDGEIAGPMHLNRYFPITSSYEFRDRLYVYRENGDYYAHGTESPSDLISECTKSGHPIRPTPKKRAGGRDDAVRKLAEAVRHHVSSVIHHWPATVKLSDTFRRVEEALMVYDANHSPTPKPATKAKGKTK